MKAAASLKDSQDLRECLICQESKNERVKGAQQGIETLKCALRTRGNRPVIDQINEISSTDVDHELWWHKSCFSTFTSREKLKD